jgi:AAA domain/DnaB-like helicase N terminal domain
LSEPEKNEIVQPSLPTLWRFEAPPSPSPMYDVHTQAEVLGRLLMQPELLQESFGDLAVSDFGGSIHQSLFRTLVKLSEEGKEFDIMTVAEAWGAGKDVGDTAVYIGQMLDAVNTDFPAQKLRLRVEKLHRLSNLRRLRSLGELLQRHAEAVQADPQALMEKLEIGIGALRSGYDLNGEMLPYAPRNLARRPDLVTLSSVEAQPVPWLWKPYLSYGMINLLSGEPGCGKTFLALAFAAALTVGKIPYVGEPCLPHDVVYLSIENSPEYVVRPRFDLLEGDANRLHVLQGAVTGEGPKARREGVRLSDIPLLEAALKQTKARFLVVDPIQSYLGGEVDMHRSNETRPIMDGLATLAQKYRVCLLILRHFAKSTAGSAINRGLGSIDLTGAARTEMHAGSRDGQSAMVHAKTNIGEIGKSIGFEIKAGVFRWTGETSITANDLASAGGMAEEDRDAANEAAQCLEDMLKGGPKAASEIFSEAKELGFSDRMIRRAKTKLGVKSRKKVGVRYGQFEWFLEDYEDGEASPIS